MTRKRCPYLGLETDPQTCYTFPSEDNLCHRLSTPQPIDVQHQSAYCLTPQYTECRIFQRAAFQQATQSGLDAEERRRAATAFMWLSSIGLLVTLFTGLYLFDWTPVSAGLFGHPSATLTPPTGFVFYNGQGTPHFFGGTATPLPTTTPLPPRANTTSPSDTPLPPSDTPLPSNTPLPPSATPVVFYPSPTASYPTWTPTSTPTATPTATATLTASPSSTNTATPVPSPSETPTPANTAGPTSTPSPAATTTATSPPPSSTPPAPTSTPTPTLIVTPAGTKTSDN
ncbi:MAG TPA: hypothetical protein ENJ02_10350 [Chloroflexi bacterium]|nr:hypothetical protein [Chloroflexota bacterium]